MAEPRDSGFFTRWSRRKRDAREEEESAPAEPSAEGVAQTPEDSRLAQQSEGDPEVVARLPDIETMDDSSDFSVFLQAGVPEALRRKALRKLWGVNPVLANLDGLNDYDEDYTQMGTMGRGLKTLYKIGAGFSGDDESAAETEPDPATAPPAKSTAAQPADSPPEPNEPTASAVVPSSSAPPSRAPSDSAAKQPNKPKGTARGRRWGGASERS